MQDHKIEFEPTVINGGKRPVPEGARLIRVGALKIMLGNPPGTSFWRITNGPSFPKPIVMDGVKWWLVSEIDAYIAERIAERDSQRVAGCAE